MTPKEHIWVVCKCLNIAIIISSFLPFSQQKKLLDTLPFVWSTHWDKSMLTSVSILISDISLVLSEERFFFCKNIWTCLHSLVVSWVFSLLCQRITQFSPPFQTANFPLHWSYFWLQSQYFGGTIDPILAYTDLIAVNKVYNYLLLCLRIPPAVLDAFKLPHHAKLTCHIRIYNAKFQARGNLSMAFILKIIFAAFNSVSSTSTSTLVLCAGWHY